jgi:hypothetical protein
MANQMLRYIIALTEDMRVREAIVSLQKLYRSLNTDKETATGIACMSTNKELDIEGRLNRLNVAKATVGKKTIRNRLNPNAFFILAYCFPYRKAPSIKIATADVVLPIIFKNVDTREGISIPKTEIKIPATIEIINGFFARPLPICFSPSIFGEPSSRYNSRMIMEMVIATIPMVAAANVVNCSLCVDGKANETKGIPKNARLPKIVLKISR